MNRIVIAMAIMLLSVSSAFAQKGQFAAPPEAELGYTQFPIYPKVLTAAQMVRLEVTPSSLTAPTVVFNHYRGLHGKDGRFVLETLPVGTVVLVDKKGVIRYKADCGNRLVELKKTPEPVIVTASEGNSTPPVVVPPTTKPGFWAWVGSGLWRVITNLEKGIDFFFEDFGWLLLFLALVMATLVGFATIISRLASADQHRSTATAQPIGLQEPAVHQVAPVVAPPAPTSVAQTLTSQIPATPTRETERTDGMPSTIYVNQGNATRPHLITWSGDIRSFSFTRRPNGSHEMRVDDN